MSSNVLLEARGIGKTYSMSASPQERFFEAVLGRRPNTPKHVVLEGIDIEIVRGETLGIMGRNGAGKTTLLGILGNVIEPTAGHVTRHGTVAVLLAVGAGFNPQLTGRANAELFCSLMGLTSEATAAQMSAIIDFAELDDYIDMPMRTYSSGMMARLGFACAIHVNADVIIIDETLAVGDASFRVKCYERIKAMQSAGQTFLLVSHSPNLISNFCTRTIVIEKGKKVFDGRPLDGLSVYKDIRENIEIGKKSKPSSMAGSGIVAPKLSIENVSIIENIDTVGIRHCVLSCQLVADADVACPVVSFGIRNHEGIVISSFDSDAAGSPLKPMRASDRAFLEFRFKNLFLSGSYFVSGRVAERVGDVTITLGTHHNIARFDVVRKGGAAGIVDLDAQITSKEALPSHDRHSGT